MRCGMCGPVRTHGSSGFLAAGDGLGVGLGHRQILSKASVAHSGHSSSAESAGKGRAQPPSHRVKAVSVKSVPQEKLRMRGVSGAAAVTAGITLRPCRQRAGRAVRSRQQVVGRQGAARVAGSSHGPGPGAARPGKERGNLGAALAASVTGRRAAAPRGRQAPRRRPRTSTSPQVPPSLPTCCLGRSCASPREYLCTEANRHLRLRPAGRSLFGRLAAR